MTQFQIITPDDIGEDGKLKKDAGVRFEDNDARSPTEILESQKKAGKAGVNPNKTNVKNRKSGKNNNNNGKPDSSASQDGGSSGFLSSTKDQVEFIKKNKTLIDKIPKKQPQSTDQTQIFLDQIREQQRRAQGKPLLNHGDRATLVNGSEEDQPYLLVSVLLSISLTAIYIAFDYMVFAQFHMESDYYLGYRLLHRYLPMFSALVFIVYLVSKYANALAVQVALLACGCIVATKVIDIAKVDSHSTFGDMQKTPGLIILWMYCVIQMRLAPSIFNVLFAAAYYYRDSFKYAGMSDMMMD